MVKWQGVINVDKFEKVLWEQDILVFFSLVLKCNFVFESRSFCVCLDHLLHFCNIFLSAEVLFVGLPLARLNIFVAVSLCIIM